MSSMPARHVENEDFAEVSPGISKSDRSTDLQNVALRILTIVGESPNRQGLQETPARYAKAIEFLTSGYNINLPKLVKNAIFDEPSGDLVLIRDIEFFSLCEHHLLPFYGVVHVAYVPDGKVIGLSKVPRLVDACARKLQVQERLTSQVAKEIDDLLKPKGVAVLIEASHLCVMMRGVEKQRSRTLTKSTLGTFATDPHLRAELTSLLGR